LDTVKTSLKTRPTLRKTWLTAGRSSAIALERIGKADRITKPQQERWGYFFIGGQQL
jgi:hypothetical protein